MTSQPPLIPLPSSSSPSSSASRPKVPKDGTDPFASLFSPTTPPSSPLFRRTRNNASTDDHPLDTAKRGPPAPLPLDAAAQSDNDDFGAFVSVAAGDDPLGFGLDASVAQSAGPSTSASAVVTSSGAVISPFKGFFDEAKSRSGANKRKVLGELLDHQDDPLYAWSHSPSEDADPMDGNGDAQSEGPHGPRASPTPIPPPTQTPKFEKELNLVDLQDAFEESQLSPQPRPTPPTLDVRPSSPASPSPSQFERDQPERTPSPSRPHGSRRSSSSPSRRRHPQHPAAHARDDSVSSSFSTLSRSWMSTLLSASLPSPTTASLDPVPWQQHGNTSPPSRSAQDAAISSSPPTPKHVSSADLASPGPSPRVATMRLPPPGGIAIPALPPDFPRRRITHGTPFASHVFVPGSATGAPGFAGESGWDTKGFSDDADTGRLVQDGGGGRRLELVGRKEEVGEVLTRELADSLRAHLPALPRLSPKWRLQYSLDQHGFSLKTLYARCEPSTLSPGALVVMRDADDGLFGAWMGEGVKLGKGTYYGSGESFLWKRPTMTAPLQVFKWTGKNEYVALCESNFLSFGGGDGHYGLYLDANLIDGSTARCPTFDNPPLSEGDVGAGGTVKFECCGLEVWCVDS